MVKQNPTSADEPAFGAFVAIDWADRKHVWSMQAAGSERRQHGEILHTPEAHRSLGGGIVFPSPRTTDCRSVEQPRGALMLSKYEHLHIYSIHPRAAAQF